MGNRAYIAFSAGEDFSPAIYLHWNGGPESVYAFLEEFKRRGLTTRGDDIAYAAARLTQIMGEFFDKGEMFSATSLGLYPFTGIDEYAVQAYYEDNGLYLLRWTGEDFAVRRWRNRDTDEDDLEHFNSLGAKALEGLKDGYLIQFGDSKIPRWWVFELSSEEVAEERAAAARHPYREAFERNFLKIGGSRVHDPVFA